VDGSGRMWGGMVGRDNLGHEVWGLQSCFQANVSIQ